MSTGCAIILKDLLGLFTPCGLINSVYYTGGKNGEKRFIYRVDLGNEGVHNRISGKIFSRRYLEPWQLISCVYSKLIV